MLAVAGILYNVFVYITCLENLGINCSIHTYIYIVIQWACELVMHEDTDGFKRNGFYLPKENIQTNIRAFKRGQMNKTKLKS